MFLTIVHSAIFHGVEAGVVAAATVDLHAFMTWKGFADAKSYNWGTALFRWLQGAVMGGLTAAGVSLGGM